MNRRDILKQSTIFAGAALSAGTISAIFASCQTEALNDVKGSGLSQTQLDLIADIAERIIPKTDTPGAKDVKVHEFIDKQVALNFTDKESSMFSKGLELFDELGDSKYGKSFLDLTIDEQNAVLADVVADSKKIDEEEEHIWPVLKGLALTGFFTSEIGATQTLVYDPIPGEWKGCIDLSEVGGLYAL